MDATLPPLNSSSPTPRASPLAKRAPRIGALGRALLAATARARTLSLVIAALVAGAAFVIVPSVVGWAGVDIADTATWDWLIAAAFCCSFALMLAIATILPPLFMNSRDRAAHSVLLWIGARETRRLYGAATEVYRIPTTPKAVWRWLAADDGDGRLDRLRVEILLMAERFDEARVIADRMPRGTAYEQFRADVARALVDDQSGLEPDVAGLRARIEHVPAGMEHVDAAAILAVLEARRMVGRGDWHAPLLALRPQIPETNWAIHARDFSWPTFVISMRGVFPLIVAFVVLSTISLIVLNIRI